MINCNPILFLKLFKNKNLIFLIRKSVLSLFCMNDIMWNKDALGYNKLILLNLAQDLTLVRKWISLNVEIFISVTVETNWIVSFIFTFISLSLITNKTIRSKLKMPQCEFLVWCAVRNWCLGYINSYKRSLRPFRKRF